MDGRALCRLPLGAPWAAHARIAVLSAMPCSTTPPPPAAPPPACAMAQVRARASKRASVRSTSAEWRAVRWCARGEPGTPRCSAVQHGRGSARRYAKHAHSCDEQYCWQRCAVDGCVKVRALQHARLRQGQCKVQHARLRQGRCKMQHARLHQGQCKMQHARLRQGQCKMQHARLRGASVRSRNEENATVQL